MCGPVLIHYTKTLNSYSTLFSTINACCPEIVNIKAFGTDGEKELITSLHQNYPNARHLRCAMHCEQNVQSKCKALGLSRQLTRSLWGQLKNVLESFITEFDRMMDVTLEQWSIVSPEIVDYLMERKETLRENLHTSHNDRKLFYTNALRV